MIRSSACRHHDKEVHMTVAPQHKINRYHIDSAVNVWFFIERVPRYCYRSLYPSTWKENTRCKKCLQYMMSLQIQKRVQFHIGLMSMSVLSGIMHLSSGLKRKCSGEGYGNTYSVSPFILQRKGWHFWNVALRFWWDQVVHDDRHTFISAALICLVQERCRVLRAYVGSPVATPSEHKPLRWYPFRCSNK